MLPDDDALNPTKWARILSWATLFGIGCGLAGPFGSYPANLFTRTIYWTILFWIGSVIVWLMLAAARRAGRRLGFPQRFTAAAGLLVACLPIAALAALGCHLFWPVHASGVAALEYYGLSVLVVFPATAAIARLAASQPAAAGTEPRSEVAARPDTEPALPTHLLELALCLQMEDHHVRIHLSDWSALHLMSMQQAIQAAGGQRGIQVHRSWWVADRAVTDWTAEGRSLVLILANGLRVPVARNKVAAVKARGLIDATPRARSDTGTMTLA
ncbi:LytTR family DNA-binding domain-containing protein [Sphingomonas nostoxanthinifaciens]|uniref:LytTR family DNA-binding domain-containing protein n=1 Tax=Sphingomonas nostoxanthinifaciens TaxID=2872652 RepID=UPI001CC1F591|nr:LytTR family DNA-binding domain-containing protein [Sphingomonas nostoxanthinifaciens]UAK24673.1 LytTR family transcriptional regulator [Sphingomonas nostoxanthinifaciens]